MEREGIYMVEGEMGNQEMAIEDRRNLEAYLERLQAEHQNNENIPTIDELEQEIEPYVKVEGGPTAYDFYMDQLRDMEKSWGINSDVEQREAA